MYYDDDYYGDYAQGGHGMSRSISVSSNYNVPDEVQDFVYNLYRAIADKKVYEVQNLYDNIFIQLSNNYYKEETWPDSGEVQAVINAAIDKPVMLDVFLVLYKELYYRDIYAKGNPSMDQRYGSYFNYCSLFNILLLGGDGTPVPIELPNQWLWDIIDEFIYQFQSFSLLVMRAGSASANNQQDLSAFLSKDSSRIWNVHSVLNVLHSLIDKSQINQQLREYNAGRDPTLVADAFGRSNLYKMLGYFSLIGLLRLHSLLGDYYQAIKVLENIDIHKQALQDPSIARVLSCQIATFYYVGFAYMMMRRYADAIRTFCSILVYLQRTRQMHSQYRTFQQDMINKQTDQMYILLNMCLVLHPQRIDESVSSELQERCADSKIKMQKGEIEEFASRFKNACPKFLSPVALNLANFDTPVPVETKIEPMQLQIEVFLDEVKQQLPILVIRSYLKLYSTMPISKLASFLEMDPEKLSVQLLSYKHKMQSIVWTSGNSGLEGEFQSGSDVDFYIDKEMIHVADTKVARRYADYFIRQIHKFEDLSRAVSHIGKK